MFLTLMVMGLVGLVMMAIPAFGRHGHAPSTHAPALHPTGHATGAVVRGHLPVHATGARGAPVHVPLGPVQANAQAVVRQEILPADAAPGGLLRFLPSPRAVFTVLALFGAFGNALVAAAHLPVLVAALVALVPALAFSHFVVTPLWNLVFRFQGAPSSPLEVLMLAEARAVVPFRNGRGLVSVERDGRHVQFRACLRGDQAALPVKVGDRLRIEDVDSQRERVTVSVLRD